jgi:hypothetical protein
VVEGAQYGAAGTERSVTRDGSGRRSSTLA